MENTKISAAALSVAALASVLTGCSGDAGSSGDQGSAAAGSELAAHDGVACPESLVDSSDRYGLGVDLEGDAMPELGGYDAVWLCEYVPIDRPQEDGNGTFSSWQVATTPVELAEQDLPVVADVLDRLTVAPSDMDCTADLGPRELIVLVDGGDLTGVAIDVFGCGTVRLTDDPYLTAPGESTDEALESGSLIVDGGRAALDDLRALLGPAISISATASASAAAGTSASS
ncbi:hypothetical protein [Demequina salsinemoris]|uniref:hypothetical protein n=1 Tax=Demequina salsinemoris TaxID=577470 RepID=UPI0007811156|nr:hypothetical protein [Demequina salsinemoris]